MEYNSYRALGFTTLQNGLIAYYSQLGLSDIQLILIIQLEAFNQRGEHFPSNEKIAANTNLTTNDVANLIQQMIDQGLLSIEQTTDSKGRIGNRYNLNPLYEKLDNYLDEHILIKNNQNNQTIEVTDSLENNPINMLARQFEVEFGRYLSPIERQELSAWLTVDHYSPEIIKMALREAVLSQVYSLKYVDRILLNWQRHNLKTVYEVKQFLQRNR
ncbi:DnaD domain protein [Lactobacillus sp. LL6]|uniref:DnaD domain protein n=1 Tax=Lactobacillus sp. LL6 TaxID=2596827 RepID=UPI0011849AC0|nr:DnaD domain protein [Lactobacillus sp. LL6]TSO26339.1 DnaD domain protein [Lactobacillus sp. LL6]